MICSRLTRVGEVRPSPNSINNRCQHTKISAHAHPVAGGAPFSNDVYHDVFLVNNAGVVTFYLDGSAQATVTTNVMNLDSSRTMNFFLDNVVAGGQAEYSSGNIALIRLYNEALTAVPPPVPEPATLTMLLAGLGVLSATGARRRPLLR